MRLGETSAQQQAGSPQTTKLTCVRIGYADRNDKDTYSSVPLLCEKEVCPWFCASFWVLWKSPRKSINTWKDLFQLTVAGLLVLFDDVVLSLLIKMIDYHGEKCKADLFLEREEEWGQEEK